MACPLGKRLEVEGSASSGQSRHVEGLDDGEGVNGLEVVRRVAVAFPGFVINRYTL